MRIGLLPLARSTFDIDYANQRFNQMLNALDQTSHEIIGSRKLLCEADESKAALDALAMQNVDMVLVLQVTFTDAGFIIKATNKLNCPLAIWAVPEPRLGGRLRLNAFCGLNLASHALSRNQVEFSYLYMDPSKDGVNDSVVDLLAGKLAINPIKMTDLKSPKTPDIEPIKIARIGEPPEGFDTCFYDKSKLNSLIATKVDELSLDDLFELAKASDRDDVAKVKQTAEDNLNKLDEVDEQELDRSYRLKVGLDKIKHQGDYDAFAIRCWPETFTEYGGAICGPASMMGEKGIPCACEADVYGAITQVLLQRIAKEPVFLADLVDIDIEDNTGVVWHCGQAPISMAADSDAANATIHTNRKMPLLYEFPLKSGRVTFMRLSQSFNQPKLIIASGEMLDRPMAFTGTSGVVKFDANADVLLKDIMDSGLEHHMALAYGNHIEALIELGEKLSIPVYHLGKNS